MVPEDKLISRYSLKWFLSIKSAYYAKIDGKRQLNEETSSENEVEERWKGIYGP